MRIYMNKLRVFPLPSLSHKQNFFDFVIHFIQFREIWETYEVENPFLKGWEVLKSPLACTKAVHWAPLTTSSVTTSIWLQ